MAKTLSDDDFNLICIIFSCPAAHWVNGKLLFIWLLACIALFTAKGWAANCDKSWRGAFSGTTKYSFGLKLLAELLDVAELLDELLTLFCNSSLALLLSIFFL